MNQPAPQFPQLTTGLPGSVSRSPELPRSTWIGGAWAAVVIVGAVLLAYANSFSGDFVCDDVPSILQNPSLKHLGTALTSPPGLSTSGRPLVNLSLALNYALSGYSRWGYHAGNLLIHSLAALFLWAALRRIFRSPVLLGRFGGEADLLSLALALIWALHPLQTESVTYIIQRAESLMGMFYLGAIYAFLVSKNSLHPARWQLASIALCLGGMASKEVMVSAPVIIFLLDWVFYEPSLTAVWRKNRGYILGLAGTWILLGYLVISLGGNRDGTTGSFDGKISALSYWLTQFPAIMTYLKLSVWPHPLIFDYGKEYIFDVTRVLPELICTVLLAVASIYGLWKRHPLGFLGFWFFSVLAPTSIIPGTVQITVEHRMYLALVPVVVVLAALVAPGFRQKAWVLLLIAACAFGILTYQRNFDYRTNLALWTDTVAKRPQSARVHNTYGIALAATPGRLADAITEYETAVRLDPNYSEPYGNLANALILVPDKLPEALAYALKAVKLTPQIPAIHNAFGNVLFKLPGRLNEAIAEYRLALEQRPNFAEAHHNLGNALMQLPNQEVAAIAEYRAALELNPAAADTHYNLAIALTRARQPAAVVAAEYEAALRASPAYWQAHYSLGALLADQPGRLDEAILHDREALRLHPDNADAELNLGMALANRPSTVTEAVGHFRRATELKPDWADAYFNLAVALSALPTGKEEAISQFQKCLQLHPEDGEAHLRLGVLLANSGRQNAEAEIHLRSALRLKASPDAQFALGSLLIARPASRDEALELLRACCQSESYAAASRELIEKTLSARP